MFRTAPGFIICGKYLFSYRELQLTCLVLFFVTVIVKSKEEHFFLLLIQPVKYTVL